VAANQLAMTKAATVVSDRKKWQQSIGGNKNNHSSQW